MRNNFYDFLLKERRIVMNTHMHCVLQRNGSTQVSWIPSEFAQEGRYLKLKENGQWTDGWKVVKAYPSVIDSEIIAARSRDYKNHRKATDL